MPTVLLTGANGFLATHILKYLVESSYDVVGTVRTQAKADDVVAAHPEFKDRVRLVAVPNMSASGAYDEVLKNNKIEYIIHAAAPVPDGGGIDFDRDFLTPAVQGYEQRILAFPRVVLVYCHRQLADHKCVETWNYCRQRKSMEARSNASSSQAAWWQYTTSCRRMMGIC